MSRISNADITSLLPNPIGSNEEDEHACSQSITRPSYKNQSRKKFQFNYQRELNEKDDAATNAKTSIHRPPSKNQSLNKLQFNYQRESNEKDDATKDRPRPNKGSISTLNTPYYYIRRFKGQNQRKEYIRRNDWRSPPSSRNKSQMLCNLNGRPQNIFEKTIYVPRYTPQPGPRGPLPSESHWV